MEVKSVAILAIYFGLGFCFSLFEWLRPSHHVKLKSVFIRDFGAFLIFSIMSRIVEIPRSFFYESSLINAPFAFLASLPVLAKYLIYLLISDFGVYWSHRLMHTKRFWKSHAWHHCPRYMYWFAGQRSSFVQQILFMLPQVFALIVVQMPEHMVIVVVIQGIFLNHWMHTNITWNSRLLEWFIVTPRYHHIHHSDNPEHYDKNIGIVFTFWDRLFGTYFDPAKAKNIAFGHNEQIPTARMIIGF